MPVVQIAISVALGLFVSWLAGHWIGFWNGDTNMAVLVGFPILCLIGLTYDRIQDSRRRLDEATKAPATEYEN